MDPLDEVARQYPPFGAALALHRAGDLVAARLAYLDLVDKPDLTALCLHQLGLLAALRGDHRLAADMFVRSLRLDSTREMTYRNLIAALLRFGETGQANTIRIDLGCQLQLLERYGPASTLYHEVLASDPLNYAASANLGTSLAWLGDVPMAARHLLDTVTLFGRSVPEFAEFARGLRGYLTTRDASFAEALPPGPPHGNLDKIHETLTTLGKALNELCHPEAAMACYRQSVAMAPNYALGHWNLALALLSEGNFTEGWRAYERRWQWDKFPAPRQPRITPWRGEPLTGKRILVWTEQGYGDIMQFTPLARELAAHALEVVLEVEPPLRRLLRESLDGVTVIPRPEDLAGPVAFPHPIDYAIPLLSLPARMGLTVDRLPLATEYLRAPEADIDVWRQRLPAHGRPRVGLVWSGRPTQADNARRSIPFEALRPLWDIGGIDWFSLQLGADPAIFRPDRVTDLAPHLNDFADTAAAIASLDLVVTVCTAVAHLAGAMGVPTWLMARKPFDWRWGRTGTTTPWYPRMRLFRQVTPDDWAPVIDEVRQALPELRPA